MSGKRIFGILGTWVLGFLLFLLCVLGFFIFFASWHTLPPESVAIVREVWVREGALFGPSALPFRIRVVENTKNVPVRLFVQPPPFGVVEEVLPLRGDIVFSFRIPLWRKDTITGNPYDGSVAFVGEVEANLRVVNHERFAKRLDPVLARYAGAGQISPLLAAPEREGQVLPRKRQDLLREVLRLDFSQRMMGELGKLFQSLHFKLYFAEKVLKEAPAPSPSERKIVIWKYLERYPWYKLEPQEMGKIVAENAEIFEKIMTYLREEHEKGETYEKLRGEIQEYFAQYITQHPQSYAQELWEYAIEKASLDHPLRLTPEVLRALTYQYLHGRPAFLENLLKNEDYMKFLTTQYGVEMKNLSIRITEDLAFRYPELLK